MSPVELQWAKYMTDNGHERAEGGVAVLGCLAMAAIAIVQMFGCFALMEDHWGWHPIASIAVMTLLLMLNLTIVLSVGCFLGALWVWDWPVLGALAIAAPGLVLGVCMAAGILGVRGTKLLFGKRAHDS